MARPKPETDAHHQVGQFRIYVESFWIAIIVAEKLIKRRRIAKHGYATLFDKRRVYYDLLSN